MWNLVNQSVAGTSHEIAARPCQDYSLGRVVSANEERILLAVCADGAGSAELAEVEALLACTTFVERAETYLRDSSSAESIGREQVLAWYLEVRDRIAAEASERGVPARELACTLLTAIVGERWAVFAQVGDGAIVKNTEEGCEAVFWPQSGEYANMTFFLTDSKLEGHIQFSRTDEVVRELAVFTDGMQMLALDFSTQRAHSPFFLPMFRALAKSEDVGQTEIALRDFLQSPRVNDRTDDDKTLLLAVRCPPQYHEPIDTAP